VEAGWDADDYEAMEKKLEGLTIDIPDMSIEEVPRHYQCHTVCVFDSLSWLLRRIAQTIVCYHERHP